MNALVLCSAALILLYAALSANVSRLRIRAQKDPEVTEVHLAKAIRAHGNASEYIPLYVVLFLYLSSLPPSTWVITLAALATLSRYAHAAGMLLATGPNRRHPLRFYGALGTYLTLFALGGVMMRAAM